MPKYIKLYEAFINEATNLYVLNPNTYSSTTVRWQKYSDDLYFAEFSLGRLWGLTKAADVEAKSINFFATTNSADSLVLNNLTQQGGIRTNQQDGSYPGNPTYNYKGQVAYAIKPADISKLETIGGVLNGTYVGSSGTSGSAGTSGTAGLLGKQLEDQYDKMMKDSGFKTTEAFMRLINGYSAAQQQIIKDPDLGQKFKDALEKSTTLARTGKKDTADWTKNEADIKKLMDDFNKKIAGSGTSGTAGTSGT